MTIKKRFQHVLAPIIAITLMSYFIYHMIQGERGFLSWRRMTQKIEAAEEKLTNIEEEQNYLKHRVSLMRPNSLDPDLLEEQAREKLNFARKDEVIIQNEELYTSPK